MIVYLDFYHERNWATAKNRGRVNLWNYDLKIEIDMYLDHFLSNDFLEFINKFKKSHLIQKYISNLPIYKDEIYGTRNISIFTYSRIPIT